MPPTPTASTPSMPFVGHVFLFSVTFFSARFFLFFARSNVFFAEQPVVVAFPPFLVVAVPFFPSPPFLVFAKGSAHGHTLSCLLAFLPFALVVDQKSGKKNSTLAGKPIQNQRSGTPSYFTWVKIFVCA
ncbi:hypothetical protein QOT17_008955 [Balamuthia mandrillaris]